MHSSHLSFPLPHCRRPLSTTVKTRLLAGSLLVLAVSLNGQEPLKTAASPDQTHFAAVRTVPEANYVWKTDMDGFRLVVVNRPPGDDFGEVCFNREIPTRAVTRFEWSPDSKYLVLCTIDSDRHTPGRFPTYVYSVEHQTLRSVDSLAGAVVSEAFRFEGPSTLIVTAIKAGDAPAPAPEEVPLALSETFPQMQPLD